MTSRKTKFTRITLGIVMLLSLLFLFVGCTSSETKEATAKDNERAITTIQKNSSNPYVEDNANILSKESKQKIKELNEELAKTEEKPQLLVITLNSLENHDIAEVATEKGKQYGVGQKDKDNGLVYILSVDDRKDFLATGYGMEDIITDSMATDMLNNDESHSAFGDGKYDEGIMHNIDQLSPYLKGDKTIEDYEKENNKDTVFIIGLVVFIIIICISIAMIDEGGSSSGRGGYYSSGSSGGGFGGGSSGGGFGGGSFGGGGGGSSW